MSFSCIASQNGSNSGSAIERRPPNPNTGRGGDVDDPRAALGHPLELLDRLVEDPREIAGVGNTAFS